MLRLLIVFALMTPLAAAQSSQPITRQLSTRWHPTVAIETGLSKLAFVAICPTKNSGDGHFFAVDSSGKVVELAYVDRRWTIKSDFSVGEPIVTGAAAALRPDEIWSIVVGTASGKIVEMRKSDMGWGGHEVTKLEGPPRAVRATEPARPGPSQLFVIDHNGNVSNWYVGASGRWNRKDVPAIEGGATHICFDYRAAGLHTITAGPKGIIGKFVQDSMGNWNGAAWDTMSAGCADLAPSADPTARDICIFYAGLDGHLRYLFYGRMNDVTSRLPCAEGARNLVGKGDQRRFNEFFGMSGTEFCLFEYNSDQADWIKVPIRAIPGPVVSTTFGPARGSIWHTMYAATADGKIYEFERDGLENE
jgi:hypothetical protein